MRLRSSDKLRRDMVPIHLIQEVRAYVVVCICFRRVNDESTVDLSLQFTHGQYVLVKNECFCDEP